ncbi:MAG: hypothetical protein LBG81_01410 [Coriobacteriaceae bacterium]|jgi:hypothetical protein|nr:hypothetical protein [Coriobacteriaceae bacterium]
MNKTGNRLIRSCVLAGFATALLLALVACVPLSTAANDAASANRKYMSQVSVTMDDLGASLESFSDAAARNDLAAMEAQSENAGRLIDAFGKLVPPDALKDIHTEYLAGCRDLLEALEGYIGLYADMKAAQTLALAQDQVKAQELAQQQGQEANQGGSDADTATATTDGGTGAVGSGTNGTGSGIGQQSGQDSGSGSASGSEGSADKTDAPDYRKRLVELKELYDSGIAHLEAADKKAAGLE